MPLYVVPRTRVWLSEEELAAAADCIPAVNESLARARALDPLLRRREDDGTFGAYCVYEATSPEHLREHAEALMLPTDAIKPVAMTVVAAPDPEPVAAA